ncbi:MAG: HAD family hydrolase, partial [Fimbriimonadaceae bacterium]
SFDAAGTLIDVKWDPVQTVLMASQVAGIEIKDPQVAGETYSRMLQSRWGEFQTLNLQRSRKVCDEFWRQLGEDWMNRIELPVQKLPELVKAADDYIFGPKSTVFTLFPDSLEILIKLDEIKIPLVMLSNWDVSLHRTCDFLNLSHYFTKVIASLEEGVEKPDPGLFQVAQNHLKTAKVLHIGDDPMADVHGARSFGWDALLLDRSAEPTEGRISSLTQLFDYL